MARVFINNDGMWYKAHQAKDKSHAERPCVVEEFMAALSEEPQHLIDVETKVQKIINERSSGKIGGESDGSIAE